MNRRILLAGAPAAVLLPGCAVLEAAGQGTGMLDAAGSVDLWGIVKGMAEVATVADPGLGTLVGAAIAAADALAADAHSGSATATGSAATLVAQANALLVRTAGVVSVKPNVPAAAGQWVSA